jgi:peptide chain release factor subunit 1
VNGLEQPCVLVATPIKDAARFLERYVTLLERLTYPRERLSLGLLESDSMDDTFAAATRLLPRLRRRFVGAEVHKHDFGYPLPPLIRWEPTLQRRRRSILARSRNLLLERSLRDQQWVLWLDVDVIDYPPDLLDRLLAARRSVLNAHCVHQYGGPTHDCNAWRDRGRLHLDDLRGEGETVPLHAVGGAVLLVRGDLHRAGLRFPSEPYGVGHPLARERGELETEGLGIMAHDVGEGCWGMPALEVLHHPGDG